MAVILQSVADSCVCGCVSEEQHAWRTIAVPSLIPQSYNLHDETVKPDWAGSP